MSFLNNQFCKLFHDFFGTKISSAEEIEMCNMTGPGLKKFCEFYLKNTISEESHLMNKSDKRVSRLLWFTIGFLVAGILVFLSNYLFIPI